MTKAIVIRTTGDPEIAGAIVDGMTRNIIPLDEGELANVRAELEAYKAREGVRAYGDYKRTQAARQTNMRIYRATPAKRVSGAILGVWGLLWLVIFAAYDYLSAWNRR